MRLGARLRGRTATQRSKKGSEKGSGKGSQRRQFPQGAQNAPLGEYDPLNMRPMRVPGICHKL